MKRIITLDDNGLIIGVKDVGDDCELSINDLVSDTGNIGQIRQGDGTFSTPIIVPPTSTPTQLDEIQNTVDILLLKQEGIL